MGLKFVLDRIVSLIGIIILIWLFIILFILIKIRMPGPAFFIQYRVGKNGKLFTIYKFRTMKTDTPKDMPTHMLEDPQSHITKLGRFLRKTSLDELPQLFNILFGQMSIVGPRPALWNQDDLVAERDKYNANSIRPGLTGWAQINGRDALYIPDKARYDGDYYRKQSLLFDLKIILKTAISILKSDGNIEGGTGRK